MNKKQYQKPAMRVRKLEYMQMLCAGSLNKISSNAGLRYGGGGKGPARSRSYDDEDWLDW